mgnify:CR=1 FL=1
MRKDYSELLLELVRETKALHKFTLTNDLLEAGQCAHRCVARAKGAKCRVILADRATVLHGHARDGRTRVQAVGGAALATRHPD